MKRSELISRFLIVAGILLAVGAPLFLWARTPLIHARMAEDGGWNPDVIQAEVGKPLHLKITSDDVVHGFAVGQMEMQSVDILPGKVTDITLNFDKPGIYTFFCTRWCGLNHWRMRGTIEVSGASTDPEPATVPLYVSLNLDIDAPHDSPIIPNGRPLALNGKFLATNFPISQSPDYYRSHSPYQVFTDLSNTSLTESQKWDAVAYLWQSNTTPESLANGKELYAQNCAACHGENGAGDGVFADDLAETGEASMQTMEGAMDMVMQNPVDFTDPRRMLGASPALLQGKILRGGMGTGMPMWGVIFTEEQIWDLIAYIYSFQFEYQK
ncbi:MAG: c-type cytochrome [Anaerolineales bacterium]|nr:MAG: c-type cytochrome [Anaerolineales bacterium]HMR99338.1 c-type cytochrome [Anaerolineales bacterium]